MNGSAGSLAFDLETMNELRLLRRLRRPRGRGVPADPRHRAGPSRTCPAWWPPGHMLGWDHTFVHEVVDLVTAIGDGTDPAPSFADGLAVQRVLDAVGSSAAERLLAVRRYPGDRPVRLSRHIRGEVVMARPVTLFTGQWADLPFEEVAGSPPSGATTGSRSPAGATTSTSGRPLRTTATCRPAGHPGPVRAEGLGDLEPPQGPGGLRRPDRRPAPGRSCRRRSGATATRKACGSGPPRR